MDELSVQLSVHCIKLFFLSAEVLIHSWLVHAKMNESMNDKSV